MKTIFKSHRLWELVEKGMECLDSKGASESEEKKKEKEDSSEDGKTLTELYMKDARALGLIQGAVSEEIFPRISHEETSKGAWDHLMQEFHGDKQHSRDLDTIDVQEVVASLKSFAQRLERHNENKTEIAFASLSIDSKSAKVSGNQDNKHHKNWKDKGTKWDNKPTDGAKNPCKHCGKLHFGECKEDLLVDIDKNVTAKVAMGTGQLVDVTGKGSIVEIYDDGSYSNLVAKVPMRGNRSFPLKLQAEMHTAYKANVCQSSIIWHRRLGHLNMDSLQLMQKQDMVISLPEITSKKGVCEGCVLGKQCREAFPKETTTRALTPIELIHSDVCAPMQTTTKAGN
ncbi:unnamed protein product, partial [Prunus brigantina]